MLSLTNDREPDLLVEHEDATRGLACGHQLLISIKESHMDLARRFLLSGKGVSTYHYDTLKINKIQNPRILTPQVSSRLD